MPYDGYFHRPTLLHHVAGNPEIRPLPPNHREATRILLDRGAEIDALTEAGPSQPDDIGWTTLGLAATSGLPGQMDLVELLLAAGADPDLPNGGALKGALYYGQGDTAARLVEAGAAVDLPAAAGLGRLDLVDDLLSRGRPSELPRLVHYGRVALPDTPSDDDILALALAHAALHGRIAVLDRLLAEGLDPDHLPPWDHRATALHWAVLGDRDDAVRHLIERGASAEVRDASHDATPEQWARSLGRGNALKGFS